MTTLKSFVAMSGRAVLPFTVRSTRSEVRRFLMKEYTTKPMTAAEMNRSYRIVRCTIVADSASKPKRRK